MGATEGMTLGLAYQKLRGHPMRWLAVLVMLFTWTARARAQETTGAPTADKTAVATSNPQPAKTATETKPEVSSKDTGTTFKLRVNLVQVRVVVRDRKGNLVEGLKREDFQLYDQGKLQTVSTFGVETPKSRQERAEAAAKTQQETSEESGTEKVALPERFVALVFDDIHLNMTDAMFVRKSAKALVESMTATDRMGLFGTSEQLKREFTSDKGELEQALQGVVPRPKMGKINEVTNCPDVTHYMADQSINKNDQTVLAVVTEETLQCQFQGDTRQLQAAGMMAQSALQQELIAGDTDNEFTYRALEDVMRRLAAMPGERILVLASPGFLLSTQFLDEMGIIDRANRSSIVINTVDARGLYTPDVLGDIASPQTTTYRTAGYKTTYRVQEQSENAYVLADFSNGTGGTFFHNSNDLEGGLKRAAAAPEVSYILGFSPQNQKMDGRYHSIKVSMVKRDKEKDKEKYDIQARRGYYAPKKVNDPQEEAKQEIAEAVFSQDEIHELPLDLQTQYFKTGDVGVHLSVVSRIDLKGIHFRKADGRNFDNLTVATVIFDENGNYITGGEKVLEMRLLDTTYDRMSRTGLTMKSSFDVKPGKYLVRQVIRDSEGAQMAARNGAVVIPY
ncbi:MAG: VWA domain-containing protein [Candidatus Acidiferrum sp.]